MKTHFVTLMLCALLGTLAQAQLTPEEKKQFEDAELATRRSPRMKEANAVFNAARKLYQQDRAKFPDQRNHEVAVAYRKAVKAYEEATRQAMLEQHPNLAAIIAKAAEPVRNEGETLADSADPRNQAMAKIQDEPGLPRVLLVGDSISIGYTVAVRNLLKGKANVHRIPVNGGATEVGLERMKDWLGDGKWDVIHFNFGLHDAKFSSETTHRSNRERYAENLRQLIAMMKATGAKLVFATTTPVPKGGVLTPTRKFDSIPERNAVALGVMKEHGVAIDDLYAVMLPEMEKFGRPNDVHFSPQGYDHLAKAVAASIEAALKP